MVTNAKALVLIAMLSLLFLVLPVQGLLAQPSLSDLARATRAQPSPLSHVFGESGTDAFLKMNKVLVSQKSLKTKPCEEWSLEMLNRAAELLWSWRHPELDVVYQQRKDKRRLHFTDWQYKLQLWAEEAALEIGSHAWNFTRDGKCAEMVQWWAHHLTEGDRRTTAALQDFTMPLMPSRGPQMDHPSASEEYVKQMTCMNCHTPIAGHGQPPYPTKSAALKPASRPLGDADQYCPVNKTTGLPAVWYNRTKMCHADYDPPCKPCEGVGGFMTGDSEEEWTPVSCEIVAAPDDPSLEGNITKAIWPEHFSVFEFMQDGAGKAGPVGGPPIDPCAEHNWVPGNYTLYYNTQGHSGEVVRPESRIDGGGHEPDQWSLANGNVYLKPPSFFAPCLCMSVAEGTLPTQHDRNPPLAPSNQTSVAGVVPRGFVSQAGGRFVGRERLTLEWVNRSVVVDHWVATTMHFWMEVATGLMVRRYQYNGLYVYTNWDLSSPKPEVFAPPKSCTGMLHVNISCIAPAEQTMII